MFPRRCPLCDGLLKKDEPYLCRKCAGTLRFIRSNTCLRCGKVLHSLYETVCPECEKTPHEFEEALAPFVYTGAVQESLVRFKYFGRAEYARFYARAIWQYGSRRIQSWNPECLVPVPIHPSRFAQRGYNQAQLIAAELEKLSGIPVEERLVRRRKKTVAQKELGSLERHRNMREAFVCTYRSVPKRVLIVDDILTTGSTADAIAHILRLKGAEVIDVVCTAVS